MKQATLQYFIKFFGFGASLALYLCLFDPSFRSFAEITKHLLKMNLKDVHLLNSAMWILGFWGIMSYLNSSKRTYRAAAWILLISATFVNLIYVQVTGNSITLNGSTKIVIMFKNVLSINSSVLVQFILATAIFIGIAMFIKPLEINSGGWLPLTLAGVVVFCIVTAKGSATLPLQAVYIVPAALVYKYILLGIKFLKGDMSSVKAIKKALPLKG
jgi:hypothetical protein